MPRSKSAAPVPQTFSPRAVALLVARDMTGVRAYDGRDVRGLARGDSGPAVLARYAERPADGSNRSHVYTGPEVALLLDAIARRHAARTGTTVAVPAPFASMLPGAAPRKSRKVATARRTAATARKVTAPAPTTAPTDATA